MRKSRFTEEQIAFAPIQAEENFCEGLRCHTRGAV